MELAVSPNRELGMHTDLLLAVIQRQAGTFGKATLEGAMNSIEANATSVHLHLEPGINARPILEGKPAIKGKPTIFTIKDNGKGFKDEEEIELFFETFGQPHGESENVIWKQFRMGRGQMFAYGKNTWRTGTFRMIVDIKAWGLNYHLDTNLPFQAGCEIEIELYDNPLGHYPYYSMETFKEDIQKQVRFVEIPVSLNGEQINTPPSKCKWDREDDIAYYLFNVGTDMTIYNLGVYVQDIRASKAGMAGVAVSKTMLNVNFARNDVDSKCEVMTHMNEVIRDNRIKKTRQPRRILNQFERQSTLSDLRDEQQDFNDVKTFALIKTAQGKHISLDAIRKNKQQWCFAYLGDPLADRMMEQEQALCIDAEMLTDLNYPDGKPKSQFFSWVTGTDMSHNYGNADWKAVETLYTDYDKLSANISDNYTTLPDKKLTVVERRVLKVLNSYNCWNGRIISIGMSERAAAWTDGYTFITLDRGFLKRMYLSYDIHVNKLFVIMAHEMAHSCDTRGTHHHGPEFYEYMVQIMMENHSPTACNHSFLDKMIKSKMDEKQAKIIAKQEKAEEKVNKKLGLAASTK